MELIGLLAIGIVIEIPVIAIVAFPQDGIAPDSICLVY
jgi:hypothetical protein